MDYTSSYNNADEFYADTKTFDAAMLNFIVMGEMADNLSEEIRDETKNKVDWRKVLGFRNIIAHNYFGIDAQEVWQIIQTSLSN